MKNLQESNRWDIIEMLGNGTWRSLLVEYSSLEEVTAEVRKLNKKALSQTSFFIRDLINESQNIDRLQRG